MKQHNTRWSFTLGPALALAAGLVSLSVVGPARADDPGQTPQQSSTAQTYRFNGRLQRPNPATPPAGSQVQPSVTAQTFQFNGRFRNFNPGNPPPGGPGNTRPPYLPPGVQETYPLAPFTQPDILRNYLQMRATSPRPNDFMGGQFNPQYRSTRTPRDSYFPPYGYVDPYPYVDYGYGGYSYGGYAFNPVAGAPIFPSIYSGYGSWYPQYLPQNRVIVQREVIYVKPEVRAEDPGERTEPRPSTGSQPAAGDYYLVRPREETLNDAIEDMRRAWLNGDYARFRARVREDGKVRIYLKGKYQYSVDGQDFGQMTHDAMTRIDTTGFELDQVQKTGENRAFVSGKHTYVDPDKSKREVYVSYGLVREKGHWHISEAGSSSSPITKHEE
jgi:hypothetical protein